MLFLQELQLDVREKDVRHEAREAQLIAEKRQFEEQLAERLASVETEHERQLDKLRMQHVVEHSNSRVAELAGKLKSCELMIQHLNERLEDSKHDREQLSKCKV